MSTPGPPGRPHKSWIISKQKIRDFVEAHPGHKETRSALDDWYKIASHAEWTNFAKVRETYGSADSVGPLVVFNIAGNKVRLIARIGYQLRPRRIWIRAILTHAEYDRGDWKE